MVVGPLKPGPHLLDGDDEAPEESLQQLAHCLVSLIVHAFYHHEPARDCNSFHAAINWNYIQGSNDKILKNNLSMIHVDQNMFVPPWFY